MPLKLGIIFFLFIIVHWACSSPAKPANNRGGDSIPSQQEEKPVPRWKTLDTVLPFAGIWVNEIYFENIGRTQSPRLSQGIMASCLIIPDSSLEATNMIAGFHEGGPNMVVVKDGDRYQFYNSELNLPLDTIELMTRTRLRIGKDYFRPLEHPDRDKADFGILEEILFAGKYKDTRGNEVVFSPNGSVTGLAGVRYYEPVIDYSDRGDRQIDRINMGDNAKKLDDYAFHFKGDTLRIYMVDCLKYSGSSCDSVRFGEMRWQLVKMPG